MAFPPAPPAPPPWVTPPSGLSGKKDKKTSYRLQREFRTLQRDKRVTSILNSGAFRNELENILRGQLEGSREPKKARSLHRPLDNVSTTSPDKTRTGPVTTRSVGEAVIPINDLRGVDATKYTVAERQVRCKLAAVYRLVNMFGWSQLIYNHISACAPAEGKRSYFVNAFGLMYHEVTASNLVRVDLDGNVLDPGSTQFGINRSGFALHSAIHSARSDIKCVIHVHTNAGIAVSSMNCGLLPISAEAISLGEVSYHDHKDGLYGGESDEWEEIGQDLGPRNKVLILHNHGLIAMGESIEEAFHIAHMLVKACEVQVAAMSIGLQNLLQTPQGVWSGRGMGVACTQGVGGGASGMIGSSARKWRVGELEFEALMRMLDNKGYSTGYRYKGLGLLEPGIGTPKTNRRDREERIKKASTDPWDFLGENKAPSDQPLSKPRQQRNTRGEPSWGFLDQSGGTQRKDATHHTPVPTTTSEAPQGNRLPHQSGVTRKSDEQPPARSNLTSLHLTAERVAHSTGEAVKQLAMHSPQLRRSGHLAPHRQIGGERDTSTHHQGSGLSPIQLAQNTAEQVAESTGQAVKRLATSNLKAESPSVMRTNQDGITPTFTRTSANTTYHPDFTHLTETETDTELSVSETDYSTTEVASTYDSIHNTPSPAHYTLMHTPADIRHPDGSSPLDRVTHTAEVVADSTSIAVEKLSKSLMEW